MVSLWGANMLILMTLLPLALIGLIASGSDDDDPSETGGEFIAGDQNLEESDDIQTGDGNDTIYAGFGSDLVASGAGDDRVFGEGDGDLILGQEGDDFLRGGPDDDIIYPGKGMDTVFGDVGDDVIQTTDSFDDAAVDITDLDALSELLINPDLSFEMAEADVANGGVGNDFLLFGGNDTVSGGQGDDIFATGIWTDPDNPATITDFEADEVIAYETTAEIAPTVQFEEDDDGNVVLTAAGETVVFVQGVAFADLSPDNLVVFVG